MTSQPGQPLLEIRGLTVEYTGADGSPVRAADSVDLTLHTSQTLGLAGESGSGKSTLAYAATRLIRPPGRVVSGEVIYHREDGSTVDLLTMGDKELQAFRWEELAIVFQSAMNALNPVRDIGSQLTDVLQAHRPAMGKADRIDRAKELLGAVSVPADRLHSFPHELSGGMRQRVMIAMSLALDPRILVLDEPTTALDVVIQREVLSQLASLRDRFGFSMLFITHDLSLLLEIADHIAIMYAGRVVEYAPAAELYDAPRHPYTGGLLDSFPSLQGPRRELTGIPGSPPDLRRLPPGCSFAPRCRSAYAPCTEHTPALQPLPDAGGRLTACHLNDPRYTGSDLAGDRA